MKTGILGGTFDPIHLGHLEAADAARKILRLDRVLLLPARTPPHRTTDPRASVFHRFAMTAIAAAERRDMVASDLELQREGPSYTSLTLEQLHAEGFQPSELFFILGSDAFAEIATWHDYPRLLGLSNFVVVSRPGFPIPNPQFPIPDPGSATSVFLIEARTPDVSSTDIRRRVAAGESIDGLVPRSVADHIQRHQLYAPASVAVP
jgi:nicotinate-nucleotide adenylyltransferase